MNIDMNLLIMSNEPGDNMQPEPPLWSPNASIPTFGASSIPSFQREHPNVATHKPDPVQSYMLHSLPNGQASPTSRSSLSTALSTQASAANLQNMAHVPSNQYSEQNSYVGGIQHMSLNQLTKPPETYLNNQEFSTPSNDEHLLQSLQQQTCHIPLTVPSDLQPMEMTLNSQQSASFQNIINQTGFTNASVPGANGTSQNSDLKLESQRQPFVHSKTPKARDWWTAESDPRLQLQKKHNNKLLQHQQSLHNKYQARQQCPANIQKQHKLQDLMNQTVPKEMLLHLGQSGYIEQSQKVQRPAHIQQPLHLRQPRLPPWPVQHHQPVQPLRPVQFHQQVQPLRPVQPFQPVKFHQLQQSPQQVQFQVPGQLHHPQQISPHRQFHSQLQHHQPLEINQRFPLNQLQLHHQPGPANLPRPVQQSVQFQQPVQLQQPSNLQTPIGQTQNNQMIFSNINSQSCLRAIQTPNTTHESAFPSVNTGNMDASFNESLNHSNGILCFANNEDFVRPYHSAGIMGSKLNNTPQFSVTSSTLSMHFPNLRTAISTQTSNSTCSTGVKMDGVQISLGQPNNPTACLSGSENNLVTEDGLSKIHEEIIKSQQNTLNLQRAYETQKRVLYPTNCYTNVPLSSVEGSLVSVNSLAGGCSANSEQVTPHIASNPQSILSDTTQTNLPKDLPPMSIAQSLDKFQRIQRISRALANFASEYNARARSLRSEQNIDLPASSKPENSIQSTSFILSQEQANISLTPVGHNQITNQYPPTSQQTTSTTIQQHRVLDGELIANSNDHISNGSARLTPLLTRTCHVNNTHKQPNDVNCGNTKIEDVTNDLKSLSSTPDDPICNNVATLTDSWIPNPSSVPGSEEELNPCLAMQKSPAPNIDGRMKQHHGTVAAGTNYFNPSCTALRAPICNNIASLTDSPISTLSADLKSEEMLHPCLAMQTSSTSNVGGTKKQHSSPNADQMLCEASGADFLKKETQEVQIIESNRSALRGVEFERQHDTVNFNLMKAVEPPIAIVNPLRLSDSKIPCKDQHTELSKTEPSQGNRFIVENSQKGMGDAAARAEKCIAIVSPSSNDLTLVGNLGSHAPTVNTESSMTGEMTGGYDSRDVNESIINQSVDFVEETKLTIYEGKCESTDGKNSPQPYAPESQDLKLGDASGFALDDVYDGNLLISSFCTLVEGNAFYDPKMAEIVDAIPAVRSRASEESYAKNGILQTVGELEFATVNNANTTETALSDMKYLKYSKIGSRLDQDPNNSNEQVDLTNAGVAKPNFRDFVAISESNTSIKQIVLDTWNKENESTGLEKHVNKDSNLPNGVTVNSTVGEINKPVGQVPCTSDSKKVDSHVEKHVLTTATAELYYEDPSIMVNGTENCADMDQVNMDYSSTNPAPNTEVENYGHKVDYYDEHTAFETEEGESVSGMLSAQSPNDQLSELLREFPHGLDAKRRKDSFEKRHSALDGDIQLCKASTISPFVHLESDYQIPLNELASKSEFSSARTLLQVEGKEAENYVCEKWQTIKRGLHYGKSEANDNFSMSSSNIGDTENDDSINETQITTMDTELIHRLFSELCPLSGIEANMECNQNPNSFGTESTNAKTVSISSSENESAPSEGLEVDYQISDNLKPHFPDSLASDFQNWQRVLCPPNLYNSRIKGPSIDKHTECEMIIGTSVVGSQAKDGIEMKEAVLSSEDNGLKRRNSFAQSNDVKPMKLDCKDRPLNTEQNLMEGELFHLSDETVSDNKSIKPKSKKESVKRNSVPGNAKLAIKFKDTIYEVDQQNEVAPVANERLPELGKDFPPLETFEDPINPRELDRKAQNVPRLVVKLQFLKFSKASGRIVKKKLKKHGRRSTGADSFKTNHKKFKKVTEIARSEQCKVPSNNVCSTVEKLPTNSKSNSNVERFKTSLEKQSVPHENLFCGERTCIGEELECNSVPVLKPSISKYRRPKNHKANFAQYQKRIQTIQEYRQHQIEKAKELEEIMEDNDSGPNKAQQPAGKPQIQIQECSRNSNEIFLGEKMCTYVNSSKSLTQPGKDIIIIEDDVSEPNEPHQPEGKTQIQVCESGSNSNEICLEENMNNYLNSSNRASKSGKDMTIVNKEAVTCQKDSLSAMVSTESSTHCLKGVTFKNTTFETICLMILGASSGKSSTEMPPKETLASIAAVKPSFAVLQSDLEIMKMVDSSDFLRCHTPDEESTDAKT